MALPETVPYPLYMQKGFELAKQTGMKIMELVNKDIKPSDILVPEAFENALAVDMALGCSTNSVLHLPAIAHEIGLQLDLNMINDISSRVPNLCRLAQADPIMCRIYTMLVGCRQS